MKHKKFTSRTVLMNLGLLLAGGLAIPVCHAGKAAQLVPDANADMPAGSQISDERMKKAEKKVQAYKQKRRADKAEQSGEQQGNSSRPSDSTPD